MTAPLKVRRLTVEEGRQLQQIVRRGGAKTDKSHVKWRRAVVVHASAGGNTVPVIARLVATSEDRVREMIHRFNDMGMASLDPQWAGGRPRQITTEDEDFIVTTAKARPEAFGQHKLHGVRQFHGCYSVGDDELWGVVRHRKSAANTHRALRSIRARRPDGEQIYVILDNLSAHKGKAIRDWAQRNAVELCFTPTYSSWANPIEAHFGPLREFVLNNSNYPNHIVLTHRLHDHLRWRNANARAPEILAAQRRERARVRAEKGRRWGRPAATQAA